MEEFAAGGEDAAMEAEGSCAGCYCAVWEDGVREEVMGVLGVGLGEEGAWEGWWWCWHYVCLCGGL